MHDNRWPIAKFTFAALLCLQAVTLTLMLLISYFGDESAYLSHAKRLMSASAIQTIQNVESLLYPAENQVVTTSALLDSAVLPLVPGEKLERYFFESLQVHTNFEGMYFGWLNGDFLYVTRSNPRDQSSSFITKTILKNDQGVRETQLVSRDRLFVETKRQNVNDSFDPRKRPWFEALTKGSIRWTRPYVYHTSQLLGVTVSIPVLNPDGEALGVLGLDIQVDNLSNFLSKNELSPNSIALMISHDQQMVAHTDLDVNFKSGPNKATGYQVESIKEINDAAVDAALTALEREGLEVVSEGVRSVDFEYNDHRHHAVFHTYNKLGVSWVVIVISPESDFLVEIRSNQLWKIISAVVVSLVVTLIAYVVLLKFLKPVTELQETVLRNSLTGLYNRRALDKIGTKSLAKSRSRGQATSVVIIDIDKFKVINDTFGHDVGDEVLVSVSQRMQNVLKLSDLIVRYGGEEFVVLLFGADLSAASVVCERLRSAVKSGNIQTESGGIPVTVSIGVCEIAVEDDTYQPALSRADKALFTAKRNGRDRVCTPEDQELLETVVSP